MDGDAVERVGIEDGPHHRQEGHDRGAPEHHAGELKPRGNRGSHVGAGEAWGAQVDSGAAGRDEEMGSGQEVEGSRAVSGTPGTRGVISSEV